MSTKGNDWARRVRGVGFAKKAILYSLGERHNIDTDLCCPDQKRLAEDSEMGIRTLQGHLTELERMRLISRNVRCTPSGRKVTYYTLAFDLERPVEGWENQSADPAPGETGDQSADDDVTKAQLRALSENPNLEPESSEAKASGEDADLFGESPPSKPKPVATSKPDEDPYKRLIFTAGVALFKSHGHSEPVARGHLGRLLKLAKDDTALVANAVTAAEKAKPADVVGWLTKAVRARIPGTAQHRAATVTETEETIDRRFAAFKHGERWKTHWGPSPDDPAANYPPSLYAKHGLKPWEAGA